MSQELTTIRTDGPLANILDKDRFEQLQRVARMLSHQSFTPAHLKGTNQDQTVANCFRVVNQAIRWGFDPFAVADETYVVHGRMGYQGKLVAAVLNTRASLPGRLRPLYNTKKGTDFAVVVYSGQEPLSEQAKTALIEYADSGATQALQRLTLSGVLAVRLTVGQGMTKNEMWIKDPEQKLWYSGAIKFARRHCPEVIQGVLTDDDMDRIGESTAPNTQAEQVAEMLGKPNKNSKKEKTAEKFHEPVIVKEEVQPVAVVEEKPAEQTAIPEPLPEYAQNLPICEATISSIKEEARRQFGERTWQNQLAELVHRIGDRRLLEDVSQEKGEEILEFLNGGPEPANMLS